MRRGVVLLVCAGFVLAGCGARTQQPASAPTVESTRVVVSATASGSGGAAVAQPKAEQLRFTAKTIDGKDFAGASLAGKPAVFWFWTPWCPRCQGEAEDIAAAAKETAGTVHFVGVAAQDQLPAMRKFVQEYGLESFPHIADTDLAVWKRFGVVEQPAHAFITPDGTVEMVLRQLPTNDLLERVRALAR